MTVFQGVPWVPLHAFLSAIQIPVAPFPPAFGMKVLNSSVTHIGWVEVEGKHYFSATQHSDGIQTHSVSSSAKGRGRPSTASHRYVDVEHCDTAAKFQ